MTLRPHPPLHHRHIHRNLRVPTAKTPENDPGGDENTVVVTGVERGAVREDTEMRRGRNGRSIVGGRRKRCLSRSPSQVANRNELGISLRM